MRKQGISFTYWQDSREADQWIIDDAGFGCKTLDVKGPYGPKGKPSTRYLVYFPYTREFSPTKKVIDYNNYKGSKDYYGNKKEDWVDKEKRKKRTKEAIGLYASVMLEKEGLQKAILMQLEGSIDPTKRTQSLHLNDYLRTIKLK